MDFKGFFKGLYLSILGTTLVLCLLFIGYSLVFNQVTANKQQVKNILERSILYENLPTIIYDAAVDSSNTNSTLPLEDPEIRQIALNVFSAEFTRTNIESLLDGTYDWLEGETEQPEITIDLKEAKDKAANKIGVLAQKKAAALPICSSEQLRANNIDNSFDVFVAECISPFVSLASVQNDIQKAFAQTDALVSDTSISIDDIKNSEGQPAINNLQNAPDAFSAAKLIPYAMLVFAGFLAFMLIHFSKDQYSGYKRIARLVGGAGVFLFLLPIIFSLITRSVLNNSPADPILNETILSVFDQFMVEAGKIYYTMGLLLILIGIGVYIFARKQHSKTKSETDVA